MSPSALLPAITAYNELWKPGGTERAAEVVHPDFTRHGSSGELHGVAALCRYIAHYQRAFPDLAFTVDDWFGVENRLLIRYGFSGTHTGSFMGVPATGRVVLASGAAVYRAHEGRIVQIWDYLDLHGLAQQLGGRHDLDPALSH